MSNPSGSGELKRSLGLFALTAYGVGDILGAGIYALVGKIAGLAGSGCWISFAVSLGVALLTGLSYAELSSRFPHSGGESVYSFRAFGNPLLSYLIGFLVLMSGVVSMAAVSHGFAGYVHAVAPGVPTGLIVSLFFLVLALVNYWGMKESSVTNIFCTAIEVTGILIVIAAGWKFFGKVNYLQIEPPPGKGTFTALFQGSVFAFYAFIGFEDMVKAAEESHEPEKMIPRAILASVGVVALLYIGTALAAVSVIPPQELAQSSAPLMTVVERGFPALPRVLFTFIALFAVTNTALVNFVMGSRLLYGMAKEGLAPAFLGKVHATRHTPHFAIVTVFVIAITLALTGTLTLLAQSTALLLLSVFLLMNVSLVVLKRRPKEKKPLFEIPLWVPCLGALTCLLLIFYVDPHAYGSVLLLALLALILYGSLPKTHRPPASLLP